MFTFFSIWRCGLANGALAFDRSGCLCIVCAVRMKLKDTTNRSIINVSILNVYAHISIYRIVSHLLVSWSNGHQTTAQLKGSLQLFIKHSPFYVRQLNRFVRWECHRHTKNHFRTVCVVKHIRYTQQAQRKRYRPP